jgi:hypothetical protein
MIWNYKERIPLDLSKFEYAYYWVKHDGMWFIAQYWPDEKEFFFCGQPYGFQPNEFEEIEMDKIQKPEHLVNFIRANRR